MEVWTSVLGVLNSPQTLRTKLYIQINVAKGKTLSSTIFDNVEKLKKLLIREVGKTWTTFMNWTIYDV